MNIKGPKAYSGVDDKAHGSDGSGRKAYGSDPYKAYSGVEMNSAGKNKSGGRKKRSKHMSGHAGEMRGY